MISEPNSNSGHHQKIFFSKLEKHIDSHAASFRRHFNSFFSNRKVRNFVITNYLRPICETLGLAQKTFYLALSMLDYFSSTRALDPGFFKTVALVCLCLAAKVNERHDKLRRLQSLRVFSSSPEVDYASVEKDILTHFGFDLNIISAYDFLTLILEDLKLCRGLNRRSFQEFEEWMSRLAFQCSLQYDLNKYNSLAVAMGILMVTRKLFGYQCLLPWHIGTKTGYSEAFLRPCRRAVRSLAEKLIQSGEMQKPLRKNRKKEVSVCIF